jgi:hypothetical protein
MSSNEMGSGFFSSHFQDKAGRLTADSAEYFDHFSSINRVAHDLFRDNALFQHVSLQRRMSSELFAVCLFIRLVEDCQAAVLLASRGFEQSVAVLVRIAIEALLKLILAFKDPPFFRIVLEADVLDQIKLLGVALSEDDLTEEQRRLFEKQRKKLKLLSCTKDIKDIPTIRLAEKAGQLKLYNSAFRLASNSVHLSPRALVEFVELRDGKPYSIVIDVHNRFMRLHVATVTEFVLIATKVMANIFRVELPPVVTEVEGWLTQLPKGWPPPEEP